MMKNILVSRRQFLKVAGSVAAIAGATPFGIRASDKSGSSRPIVGACKHTYEVIHDWGELPKGLCLGNTHGVTEDSQGRIFIKHTVGKGSLCDDAVLVFDGDGRFIKSWG